MATISRKKLLMVVAVALVLLGAWYLWGPSGGNLTLLNEDNFAQFTGQFDGPVHDTRILLLLSPT